jgi:hypothetical protein
MVGRTAQVYAHRPESEVQRARVVFDGSGAIERPRMAQELSLVSGMGRSHFTVAVEPFTA